MKKNSKKRTPSPLTKTHNPYEDLQAVEQYAVDLKIENVSMVIIAGILQMTYDSCRQLFAEGGRLYEPVAYRRLELSEAYADVRNSVDNILKKTAVEAALMMRNSVRRGGMIGVVAAKDILDRTGFKPPDQVELPEDDEQIEKVVIYLPKNGRQIKSNNQAD